MGSKDSQHHASDPHQFFGSLLYKVIFPLTLILTTPVFVLAIVYANVHLDGSLYALAQMFRNDGLLQFLEKVISPPTSEAWTILGSFVGFEALLMMIIPGKTHRGPLTATGHTPVYTGNGFQCFSITMATLYAIHHFEIYDLANIYDLFPQIMAASGIFSLFFCAFLVIKGIVAPSSTDNQVSGNPIFDFFWGVELYPRFGSLDLKTLVNCRTAMMGWPILLICYLLKQQKLNNGEVADTMYVSVGVQLIYIAKFFWWETGYFDSIDIMHDRFGFYICWGCLNWLPSLYTNCTFFLVTHPINIGTEKAALLFLAGVLAVYINYDVDEQRQRFRKTQGNTTIWGKKPEYIEAAYKTTNGEVKKSLLLVSGWWGVSRHFNYVAELTAALLWAPPVQFTHFLPYAYYTFLLILLVHRAFRDDIRCAKKYGKFYNQYKAKVPYRMIPGFF